MRSVLYCLAVRPLLCSILLLLPPFAAQATEPAGRVLFAVGTATAVAADGSTRELRKGDAIEEGDLLVTGDGRLQIVFKDNAVLALYPGTRFQIDRYRYTAKGDDADSVALRLLKGGLRTISGLVGKRNRSDYSMEGGVATIGIRGTEYGLLLGETLVGSVGEGAIEVCNAAGCLPVAMSQAFLVPSRTEMPVLAQLQAHLPAPRVRKSTAAVRQDGDEAAVAANAAASAVEDPAPARSDAGAEHAGRIDTGKPRVSALMEEADAVERQEAEEARGRTSQAGRGRGDGALAALARGRERLDAHDESASHPGRKWGRRQDLGDEDFAKRLDHARGGESSSRFDALPAASAGARAPSQPAAAARAPSSPAAAIGVTAVAAPSGATTSSIAASGAAIAPVSSATSAASLNAQTTQTFVLPVELPPGLAKKLGDSRLILPPGLLKKLRD